MAEIGWASRADDAKMQVVSRGQRMNEQPEIVQDEEKVIAPPAPQSRKPQMVQRILILGGGFGGWYTARNLEKLFRNHAGVEITLVSRDNYFLMTPFLFEAG